MVKFQEDIHQYTNSKEEVYLSATSLIHKYAADFDSDYWSMYKAIEELDSNFKKNKKVYLTLKTTEYLLSVIPYQLTKDNILEGQQKILKEWKVKNDASKIKGTAFHKGKENAILNSNNITFENASHKVQDYKVMFENKSLKELRDVNYHDSLPDGYYSELLLFHHGYKIAGTADVVVIKSDDKGNRFVLVDDFKTNQEIKTENRFQKMKHPLQYLDDCNYNHYNLQTSLYGYLLECMGFKVIHTRITWIDSAQNEIPFIFEYKRQQVISMLEHYTANKNIEAFLKLN